METTLYPEKKLSSREIEQAIKFAEKLVPLLYPVKRFEIWAPQSPDSEKAFVYPGKRTLDRVIATIVSAYVQEDPYMLFLGTIPLKAAVFSRDLPKFPPTCKVIGLNGLFYSIYVFSSEIEASRALIEKRHGSLMEIIPLTVGKILEFSGKVYSPGEILAPTIEETPEVVEADFEEEISEKESKNNAPSTFREARSFKDPEALIKALSSLELKGNFQAMVAENFPSQTKKNLFPLQDAIAFPLIKPFARTGICNVLLLHYPTPSTNILRPAKKRLLSYEVGFYMPARASSSGGKRVTVVIDSVLKAALAQEAVVNNPCQSFSISVIGAVEPQHLLFFKERKELLENSYFVFLLVGEGREVLSRLRGLQQGNLREKIKVTSQQRYFENFLLDPCITLSSLLP